MASLPIFKDSSTNLMLLQNKWSSILNPIIAQPLSSANIIKGVKLVSGNNTINHGLQQALQGYIIIGMQGAFAQIYQVASQTPTLTLILNANSTTTVDLLVF